MIQHVFVYGNDAFGGSRHALVGDRLFVGRALAKGVAYAVPSDDGGDAALSLRGGGDAWVGGELYPCDPALLEALDAARGASYTRQVIRVRAGSGGTMIDAWAHAWAGAWEGLRTLPGGLLPSAPTEPFPGPTAWYFGYASNMFHFADRRKLTTHGMRLGRIDGLRIAFAKDSGDGINCYATLLPKRGGVVKGALYRMRQTEIEGQLDPQEKEGWHLERRTFEVTLDDGTERRIWAEAYVCYPRWWFWGRISHPVNTQKIVPGAKLVGLDADYVAWLEAFVDRPCNPEDYDLGELHLVYPQES